MCAKLKNPSRRIGGIARGPLVRHGLSVVVALIFAVAASRSHRAAAQDQPRLVPWEYSPYRITVWTAWSDSPEANPRQQDELARRIAQECESRALAEWDVAVEPIPAVLRAGALQAIEDLSPDQIVASAPEALAGDKLMLVAVVADRGTWSVAVRELDCRTRLFGHVVERRTAQSELLGLVAADALFEAFRPMGRIERTEDSMAGGVRTRVARVRIRGGGLALDDRSPVYVPQGGVLRPIVRRNDRLGNPRPGGIQVVPLTLLEVLGGDAGDAPPEVDAVATAPPAGASPAAADRNSTFTSAPARDASETVSAPNDTVADDSSPPSQSIELGRAVLRCQVHSGIRGALGGRTSLRLEQLALLAKPGHPSTRLRLQTAGAGSRPLGGYDVYARPEIEGDRSALIGRTDWRGALYVPPGDKPVRVLYVKSGARLLARIPLMPGLDEEEVVQIPDDDRRLEAEGVVVSLEGYLMDAVVQRELLVARIRRHIDDGKFDEAEQQLARLRSFERPAELERLLVREERRFVGTSPDPKDRIAPLFTDARGLINQFLNPNLPQQLDRELKEARRAAGSAE